MILFELELEELGVRWRVVSLFMGEVDFLSSFANDLLVRGI